MPFSDPGMAEATAFIPAAAPCRSVAGRKPQPPGLSSHALQSLQPAQPVSRFGGHGVTAVRDGGVPHFAARIAIIPVSQ